MEDQRVDEETGKESIQIHEQQRVNERNEAIFIGI